MIYVQKVMLFQRKKFRKWRYYSIFINNFFTIKYVPVAFFHFLLPSNFVITSSVRKLWACTYQSVYSIGNKWIIGSLQKIGNNEWVSVVDCCCVDSMDNAKVCPCVFMYTLGVILPKLKCLQAMCMWLLRHKCNIIEWFKWME